MKRLSILGSTGSIGRNALKIVAAFPDRFSVAALTAHTSVSLLAEQIRRFRPETVAVSGPDQAAELEALLGSKSAVDVRYGPKGYAEAASVASADTVVTAMVGAAGLLPTLAAIDAGKDIALANKETLVMAGEIVMRRAGEKGVAILPVDSEHSAIFQCLAGNRRQDLDRILLTGSGGPFRTLAADRFSRIRVEDALAHPNWAMGKKISVDSSTLMNKGLEFIEARHLFGVTAEQIEVVIHPQSIVHSMVAFVDGSVVAQLGAPDMRGAIAYALSHPGRLPLKLPVPDFAGIGQLAFEPPDLGRFPCLALALEASRRGGTLPAVLNAANEVAVAAFLDGRLAYTGIAGVVEEALGRCGAAEAASVPKILADDARARRIAADRIRRRR